MTLRYFPAGLLIEGQMMWELSGATIDGGATLTGARPIARLDGGGLWKAVLTEIGLWTASHRRTWRALTAVADNGAMPIIVPCRETVDAPWPVVAGVELSVLPFVPFSDGATFSDGTSFASSCIDIRTTVPAALRATSMTVRIYAGRTMQGGEKFSIDHDALSFRMYQIRTAVDNGDGTAVITFRPPLRAAVVAGQPLDFDRPKCVMRLSAPDAMDATLSDGFFGRPSASFIEAFPPFPDE
jgi:hypothetical protein